MSRAPEKDRYRNSPREVVLDRPTPWQNWSPKCIQVRQTCDASETLQLQESPYELDVVGALNDNVPVIQLDHLRSMPRSSRSRFMMSPDSRCALSPASPTF